MLGCDSDAKRGEHEVDGVGEGVDIVAGEKQGDGMAGVDDDEGARVAGLGARTVAGVHDDLVLEPGQARGTVVDKPVEAGVDDRACGDGGGSAVLAHRLADGGRSGRVGGYAGPEDGGVDGGWVGQGSDRGVDVVRAGEVDALESREEGDVVARGDTAFEGAGLDDARIHGGGIGVGDDVVVAQQVAIAAADALERWWVLEGSRDYPNAKALLLLADCGGGNSARARVWKRDLQRKLADRHGLTVVACHYPPGASKWNPSEHRLFSEISKNWAGVPLESYETVLNYIATTTTAQGLKVQAILHPKEYEKGERVTDAEMKSLRRRKHKLLPEWNYTIKSSRRPDRFQL